MRVTWGWNERSGNGQPRYPQTCSQWLLLHWVAPESGAWGTRRQWYERRYENGETQPSPAEQFGEDWPSRGAYEVFYAYPPGVAPTLDSLEAFASRYVNRPELPSEEERDRIDRALIAEQEARAEEEDYQRFSSRTPASLGEPWIGSGSNAKGKRPEIPVMPRSMEQKMRRMIAARIRKAEQEAQRSGTA